MATMATANSGSHADWAPHVIARETLRFRQAKLVLASRILRRDRDVLTNGQVIDVFKVGELDAQDVPASRELDPETETPDKVTITINKFKAVPFEIGVDMDVQSAIDGKKEYSIAAGYGIAKALDTEIWDTADNVLVTQTDTITGAIDDDNLRKLAQYLEDADAMFAGDVYLATGPKVKNQIISMADWKRADFLGTAKGAHVTGQLSDIYGMVPLITTLAGTDSNGYYRCLAFQKEGLAAAIQKTVGLVSDPQLLKTVYAAWNLFGVSRARLDHLAWARINAS